MILNEQILKKQKIYFHGSKYEKLDKSHSHFDNWFFISCDITTSLLYCKKTEDEIKYIHTFRLKRPLNIFNANSKVDYAKLRKALMRKGYISFANNEMFFLKKNDWSQINDYIESDITRSELVNIVEDLGYDGFFNFEFDEDKSHCNDQFSKPSIGIFGDDLSDKLVYLGVQPIEQLKSFKYNDIHDSDIREVSLRLKAIAKISKSEDEFYEKVEKFYNDYPNFYSTLTKKDYLELAKGIYKPLTESQLFENIMKHEKAYNKKMEEYGWKVPPKEI